MGVILPEVGCDSQGLDCQNHSVWPKAIKRTLRIENLLGVSIEVANVDGQVDAERKRFGAQQRHNRLNRKRAQNGESEGDKGNLVAKLLQSRNHECSRGGTAVRTPQLTQPSCGWIPLRCLEQAINVAAQRVFLGHSFIVPGTRSAVCYGCTPRQSFFRRMQPQEWAGVR